MLKKTNNESALGQKYHGLRSTNSSYGTYNESTYDASGAPIVEPKEMAPILPTDVDTLIEILVGCPIGKYALRVFQQHDAGLCWQDSFFIMLYNQDWYKATLEEQLRFYMEEFFKAGETDLTYAKNVEVEQPNFNSELDLKTYTYTKTVKVTVSQLEHKIKPVAVAFKKRYGMGLPLKFWEYMCLNLHRYLLLGYLFMKNEDIMNVKRASKPSMLFRRKRSIGHFNYSTLHVDYKEYVLSMLETGMYYTNFQLLKQWLLTYVEKVSGGKQTFLPFDAADIAAADIGAYYIALNGKHIISLFKCGGSWFIYDIDIGCKDFSAEDTAKLEASRIISLFFEKKSDEFVYSLTLSDGETVGLSMPLVQNRPHKYDGIVVGTSFILAVKHTAGGQRRKRTLRRRISNRKTRRV